MKKRDNQTLQSNRKNRPRGYYKCFSYIQKIDLEKRYGYNYESENPVLQELKETFSSKCDLYNPKMRAMKLGREKYKRKEEINFKPTMNPILGVFRKFNSKYVLPI